METITSHKVNGLNKEIEIEVLDEPGDGGACHRYRINLGPLPDSNWDKRSERPSPYTVINFQEGPIKEEGVNGISNESLLAIVEHRLQGFQSGEFSCSENLEALNNVREALRWLNNRTLDRLERGVEGTNEK